MINIKPALSAIVYYTEVMERDESLPPIICDDLQILDALEDLISIVDQHYRYVAVSSGYLHFFGLPKTDIIGKHAAELHGQERFETHIQPNLDRTLTGEEVRLRFWTKNSLGEMRFMDSRHAPVKDSAGNPCVAVVARDITDLINTQHALEQERLLLDTMINALPDFIFVKSPSGTYQRCNKSFETLLATNKEEILGKNDSALMSKHSAAHVRRADLQVLQQRKALRIDEWATYRDGRKRLIDMHKIPLLDKEGELYGLMGIGHDVTRERELERQQQLAALVFESTSDYCFILAEDGTVVSANHSAKQQFPALNSEKSLLITTLLMHRETDFQEILDSSLSWSGELICPQHTPYLATLNAVLDSDKEKFVLTLRDYSQQKALEQMLRMQAHHDPLTGLPNRLLLHSKMNSAIIRAERQHQQLAVLFIDLDDFKPINDQHGHHYGDKVLVQVATRLRRCLRQNDTLARLGGDEFVVLIDITALQDAVVLAYKLLGSLTPPLLEDAHPVSLSACIGISLFPQHADNAIDLLQCADEAMYTAKGLQGESIYVYQAPE